MNTKQALNEIRTRARRGCEGYGEGGKDAVACILALVDWAEAQVNAGASLNTIHATVSFVSEEMFDMSEEADS